MYTYIYDSFLLDRKYENTLYRIETRLLELGINGRVEKLTLLKSVKEIIADAVSRSSDTIVVVGNDETIAKAIAFLPARKAVLGIIPVGPNTDIAHMLGIPEGVEACNVLSKRIMERIDLGKANGRYFLSQLVINNASKVTLDCDQYHITALSPDGVVKICNLRGGPDTEDVAGGSNPQDGILEAVIEPETKRSVWNIFSRSVSAASVFPIKKMHIRSSGENLPVMADGQTMLKTPVTVEIIPRELRVIVGRKRTFGK